MAAALHARPAPALTAPPAAPRREPAPLILHLELPPPPPTVRWEADVVDNENMNRKKSKRCCIFHKQRPFDESSSDDDDEDDPGGWEVGPDGKPVWVPNEAPASHGHGCSCHHPPASLNPSSASSSQSS